MTSSHHPSGSRALEANLNPQQLEAVRHRTGPLLIYAGAGSGKTMVITHSIAHMVENGAPASSIMAVTFTNKAAKELRERVENLVGFRARNMLVSTFHSACVRFLRLYAAEIGFTNSFSIFDDSESGAIIKSILKDVGVVGNFLSPSILENKIDRLKNAGLTPEAYLEKIHTDYADRPSTGFRRFGEVEQHELVQKCYAMYQQRLREQNAMDFGDLILETVRLFETKPHVLASLQNRFEHFLVDEFQDTNPIQFKLITLLCSHTRNLRVVGDDDQSIYSWRGAEPGFILDFAKIFPDAKVVYLETNYRSTGAIVQGAAGLISNNHKRAEKTLRPSKEFGEPIRIKACANVHDEAEFVARSIMSQIERGATLSQLAVLYRTNSQSRVLEDELRRRMLPYVIFGSVRFYERAEIKILLAYLKLLVNPSDDISFRRVIGVPKRGFGEKALDKLQDLGEAHNISLARTAQRIVTNELKLEGVRGLNGLKEFANCLINWFGMMQRGEAPSAILDSIITCIDYQKYLAATYPEDFDERWLNVVELKNALIDFERKAAIENGNPEHQDPLTSDRVAGGNIMAEFLHQAMLVVEPTAADLSSGQADAVSLMTIHSAKGLEFDYVYLTGLEEGVLPHVRSLEDPAGIEEERRLMYVAMTRARQALTISRSRDDIYRHERKIPSRFLTEIPHECIQLADRDKPPPKTIQFGVVGRELRYVPEE